MPSIRIIRVGIFLCALTFSIPCFPCECSGTAPACAYVSGAPIIFVGTPVYSNDDGSGTFVQQTLYKFKVEEIFKGLPGGTKEVWVDPGSYTSCYAEYKVGTRLLVFASQSLIPPGTAAMSVANPTGKQKPWPPGFDPKMPVYYAPECAGTRPADDAADEIAWLRLWKKGEAHSSIRGLVTDEFRFPLPGVIVTAKSSAGNRTAATDAAGAFSLEPVAPGKYQLDLSLTGYRSPGTVPVDVPNQACEYLPLGMGATGILRGSAVDQNGKPVAGVELTLARLQGGEMTFLDHLTTSSHGVFRQKEVPAGDYLIGVNILSQPNTDTPYAPIFVPGVPRERARVIHLAPGQTVSGIHLQLPPPLQERTVHVQVEWPDGRSAGAHVSVLTDETDDGVTDIEETKDDGTVSVKCFAAQNCKVVAKMWLKKPGEVVASEAVASQPKRIEPGDSPVSITLILSERRKQWRD